jgi:cold shock CspA family protein
MAPKYWIIQSDLVVRGVREESWSDISDRLKNIWGIPRFSSELQNLVNKVVRINDSVNSKMNSFGILSKDNHGVVFKYVRRKGFGFILDKETRKEIWFHHGSAVQSAEGPVLEIGSECL